MAVTLAVRSARAPWAFRSDHGAKAARASGPAQKMRRAPAQLGGISGQATWHAPRSAEAGERGVLMKPFAETLQTGMVTGLGAMLFLLMMAALLFRS